MEAAALIPDGEFHADPVCTGDEVSLQWPAQQAHPVAA